MLAKGDSEKGCKNMRKMGRPQAGLEWRTVPRFPEVPEGL